MDGLEKRNLLILSTAHVTKKTAAELNSTPCRDWPVMGGPYGDVGWFFYCHETNEDGRIPAELFSVMQFARSQGCINILFDMDADRVDELPSWDW